jgi:hypothetical protein
VVGGSQQEQRTWCAGAQVLMADFFENNKRKALGLDPAIRSTPLTPVAPGQPPPLPPPSSPPLPVHSAPPSKLPLTSSSMQLISTSSCLTASLTCLYLAVTLSHASRSWSEGGQFLVWNSHSAAFRVCTTLMASRSR